MSQAKGFLGLNWMMSLLHNPGNQFSLLSFEYDAFWEFLDRLGTPVSIASKQNRDGARIHFHKPLPPSLSSLPNYNSPWPLLPPLLLPIKNPWKCATAFLRMKPTGGLLRENKVDLPEDVSLLYLTATLECLGPPPCMCVVHAVNAATACLLCPANQQYSLTRLLHLPALLLL